MNYWKKLLCFFIFVCFILLLIFILVVVEKFIDDENLVFVCEIVVKNGVEVFW